MKVLDEASLTAFLNSSSPPAAKHNKPIEFNSKAQLLKSLSEHGYKFDEQVKVKGVSGAEYTFDILAYIDSDIITHPVSIDFLSAEDEVGMEPLLEPMTFLLTWGKPFPDGILCLILLPPGSSAIFNDLAICNIQTA